MSVATKNPFAILEDDNSRPSTPPPASKAQAQSASQPTPRGNLRGRGGPASRGGRYYQRGGASAKSSTPRGDDNNADPAAAADDGEVKKRFDGEGRGRGRGRGRGDRGDRGRGRGRTFDRHSATGKTDSDKKLHQGWGGDEGSSELKAEAGGATDAAAEATNEGWGNATVESSGWGTGEAPPPDADATAPAEEDKPAEGRRGRDRDRDREPEEEDNTLTLEQYLQQQKEKGLSPAPKLETRKANEGDDSIWKDAVVVNKKDEEEGSYFVGKSKAMAPKARSKKDEKVFIEIEARFERPARGTRGRGGDRPPRGERGSRGRGGGGRGRANGNNAPELNVDDQAAFPSLS